MGVLWRPEPSRRVDDMLQMPASGQMNGTEDTNTDNDESESSDNLMVQFDHSGYELLPPHVMQGLGDAGGDSSDDSDNSDNESASTEIPQPEEATAIFPESNCQNDGNERADIDVDCEQVRAAMRQVTLPPSAIPPWAAHVPEAHWTSFLVARISNMQDKSTEK